MSSAPEYQSELPHDSGMGNVGQRRRSHDWTQRSAAKLQPPTPSHPTAPTEVTSRERLERCGVGEGHRHDGGRGCAVGVAQDGDASGGGSQDRINDKALAVHPAVWAPERVAAYLTDRGFPQAASAALGTVRKYSHNELDGPRLLRGGASGLAALGIPAEAAARLYAEVAARAALGGWLVHSTTAALADIESGGADDVNAAAVDAGPARSPAPVCAADAAGAADAADSDVCTAPVGAAPAVAAAAVRRSRVEGSMYGIFVGDALAMPVHWYYSPRQLRADYGSIEGYVAPKAVHSSNVIMAEHWRNNKHEVQTLVCNGHILTPDKAAVWARENAHYHNGMVAGENTLNAQVARGVVRTMTANGGVYDRDAFLAEYKRLLTTPGAHPDTFVEAIHRQFFANHLLRGTPLESSAGSENHDTPSIGGFVALSPILLGQRRVQSSVDAVRTTAAHLGLTHRSPRLAANMALYAEVLYAAAEGEWPQAVHEATAAAAAALGHDLIALGKLGVDDTEVVHRYLGPACYIGSSLPVVLYFAHKYSGPEFAAKPAEAFRRAVLANANAGGENAHRGSALGALLGAAVGVDNIPPGLLTGLAAAAEIRTEIEAFCELVAAPDGCSHTS
mmetsp:Transcript_15456/g.45920  ORF Transcript_15456/g.45920 Transcript_15456/m.45920 type:complete len:619 (+) Transcript_15456:1-1857(+)